MASGYYDDESTVYEVEVNGQKFKYQKGKTAKGVRFGDTGRET